MKQITSIFVDQYGWMFAKDFETGIHEQNNFYIMQSRSFEGKIPDVYEVQKSNVFIVTYKNLPESETTI